jgi:hypothetical protein
VKTSTTVNIAVGCVMGSQFETKEKQEVIEVLRNLEKGVERE